MAAPPARRRVLHVAWRLSRSGGIPIVVRQVAGRLDPARFDAHVATVRPAFDEDGLDELPSTVTLHPLGFTGSLTPLDRARAAVALVRLTRTLRPDVLHLHSGTAGYSVPAALLGRGGRRVLEVHDAPGNQRHGRATEWLEGQACRRLGFVPLVHSTSVRAEVAAFTHLAERRVELVPLGIDTRRLAGASADGPAWRRRHDIPDGAALVLHVGRLVPTKNLALLVDVAERVRGHHGATVFAVVGSGPEEQRLADRVGRAGLDASVRLLGACSDDDLVAAYHACDIFLSTSDYEGFGLAVAEAMAAGRPVVATAVGGVTDLVEDGRTGLLADRGSANALAQAVTKLLDDPTLRAAMGDAGAARARDHFDVAGMVASYEDLYDRLCGGAGGGGLRERLLVLKSPAFGAPPAPGPLPYRIDHLAGHGIDLRWTDAHLRRPWTVPPARAIVRRLERAGPPSLQTMLALPRIAASDAVVAMFESEGNLLAWLRRTGVPGTRRPGLVVLSCWLAELLPGFSERRRRWYRRTYRHVDRLVYFSSNQTGIFERHLGMPTDRLRCIPFGVDHEAFRPSSADDGFVLAVGRDRGRDWPTFLDAAARTGLPTKVLCRPSEIAALDVPANVEVLGYVGRAAYADLLARSRLVVVASRPLAYPTGQSVVLEAMATAKCCVATAIPSMRDYLVPGVNALTVPAGDAGALAAVVAEAFEDGDRRRHIGDGGRQAVEERFNAQMMWKAIATEVHAVARRR